MTALNRSSKSPRKRVPASSAPVSSAKTSASLQRVLHVVGPAAASRGLRPSPSCRRRLADEHRVVLAAAAQDLDRALQFVGAADQRIEQPLPGALGQVDAVGAERIVRRGRPFVAGCRPCRSRRRRRRAAARRLGDAVRDVLEDVEPRDALLGEQPRGLGLRLLQDRGEDVAGLRLPGAARSARAARRSAARGGTPRSARARASFRAGICSIDSSRYASARAAARRGRRRRRRESARRRGRGRSA